MRKWREVDYPQWHKACLEVQLRIAQWKQKLGFQVSPRAVRAGRLPTAAVPASIMISAEPPSPPAESSTLVQASVATSRFFERDGVWFITHEGEECHIPRMLDGFKYIRLLIRIHGRTLRCSQMLSLVGPASGAAIHTMLDESDGLSGDHCPQAILDNPTIQGCKVRLQGLKAERAEAEARGDQAGLLNCDNETAKIEGFLNKNVRGTGKSRMFSDENEKARLSVRRAIERAIKAIQQRNSKLGDYFDGMITTGNSCIFRDTTANWLL